MLIGRPLQKFPYKPSTEDTIYLIDFGVAKSYLDPETNVRVQFAEGATMVGTYMFMSAKCHLNIGKHIIFLPLPTDSLNFYYYLSIHTNCDIYLKYLS